MTLTAIVTTSDRPASHPGPLPGSFSLIDIENVNLTGGDRDNRFEVFAWDGGMEISGEGGEDTLRVEHFDLDMILQNTSVALANGSAYQFTSIEEAILWTAPMKAPPSRSLASPASSSRMIATSMAMICW